MSEKSTLVDKLSKMGAKNPKGLAAYVLEKRARDSKFDLLKKARELGRKDALDFIKFNKEMSK